MSTNIPIHTQLTAIEKIEQKLSAKRVILLEQSLHSTNPSDLIKANDVINVDTKNNVDRKTFLVDPHEFQSFMGYKDKPYSLSYSMLRRTSYAVPIIRSIISTRIDQVTTFCEPQKDKYSTGFKIKKKQSYFNHDDSDKLTKDDMYTIEKITMFLLNCGLNNKFEGDDFDSFVRKLINDSLTFDQMTFEVVDDRRGRPVEFYAADASTIRITDCDLDENVKGNWQKGDRTFLGSDRVKKMGYMPSHCQIKDNQINAEYYPWEMCFGVRNPTSNIYSNGYGISEIETLTQTLTSMLWSDEYNRRFFSQGSAPKGFFKIKPGTSISDGKISQFKQQWQSMMSGVYQSHKTPVLEGDIDWVDLQHNNRDMEFSHWQEYLIKLSCAAFRIDPAEINFPLSGGSEQKAMFEGNNEARLKHSKDKGLYPLLRFLERKINKFIVSRINPNFVFEFTGMDVDDKGTELESDIKMMSNFMTVDEIRIKRGMKPIGEERGGNVIANGTVFQAVMAAQQAQQQEQGGEMEGEQQGEGGEDQNQFDQGNGSENTETGGNEEENPFEKALNDYLKKLQ